LRQERKGRNTQAGLDSSLPDVRETALTPGSLDLDIFREMYRDGAANLMGIDPRLNATRIAHKLKVGRARVAGRLKSWSDSGFLCRYDVWLNPSLFGYQGAWLNIRVDHPRTKPALFARLGLMDGAVSALEFLGDWLTLGIVAPDSSALERVVELIRGLAGVEDVEPPLLWRIPPPKRQLTPLDIRIVRALRERPTATLSATAQRVGISTRTMTRRYSELIEGWAVWFAPVLDFRALSSPVVSVGVSLRPEAGRERVARRVRTRYPLTLEFGNVDVGPDIGAENQIFLVMPPSPAHLEELEQFVGSISGVVSVETNVMVRIHSFPSWFDRHLASLAPPRP
jgi:DNA-binding Lrp family transcriptional regulator